MNVNAIATSSAQDFVATGARIIAEHVRTAIADHGCCVLGLSGGSTPGDMYRALAKADINWGRIWMFLVDERCVPPEHTESNAGMIRATLLQNIPLNEKEHIVLPQENLLPDACAAHYNEALGTLFGEKGWPDCIVLGMGEDGHTASLFPPLSNVEMGGERAIHTHAVPPAIHDRITVTLGVLLRAHSAVLLLRGNSKKKVWEEMLASPEDETRWPIKALIARGNLTVIFGP